MDHRALEEKVYRLVSQAAPEKVAGITLGPEVSLRRDLGLDSLGLATLLFNLGEEMGIDPNDLIDLLADAPANSVGDLVALGIRITSGAGEGSA
jgi:acyl carrier protein